MCGTLKGALKTAPGNTLTCGAVSGGTFVPATRRGRYITIDLTPPPTRQGKPGSERLVVAEVTATAKGEVHGSRRHEGAPRREPTAGYRRLLRTVVAKLLGCSNFCQALEHLSPGSLTPAALQ